MEVDLSTSHSPNLDKSNKDNELSSGFGESYAESESGSGSGNENELNSGFDGLGEEENLQFDSVREEEDGKGSERNGELKDEGAEKKRRSFEELDNENDKKKRVQSTEDDEKLKLFGSFMKLAAKLQCESPPIQQASLMAGQRKGKLLIFSLLIVLCSMPEIRILVNSSSVPVQSELETEHVTVTTLNDQQNLLQKLDELLMSVKNLGDIVHRLESRLPEQPRLGNDKVGAGLAVKNPEMVGIGKSELVDESLVNEAEEEGTIRDVERLKAVSVVTRFNPFWSEKFQFVSVVKLDSDATCINVLPNRDQEGLSKYVAVGYGKGIIHVFSRTGEVLVEFDTISAFPITAMLSYTSIYKNESVLITGHSNGDILMHRLWERSNGEESSSLVMENVGNLASCGIGEDGSPISNLEVHYVGRTRYVLSTDVSGIINVFKENGTLHGSVVPKSKPLALLKQMLLFLTETGAGSLDLRSMRIRESECEGMNHSRALYYAFDATERSKAYGLTSDGDLFYVSLLGDIMNFKCRVRFKRKLEMEEPLAFQVMKGYLLIVNEEKVSVYNVSALHYGRVGGPRLLFSASLDEIRSTFINHNSESGRRAIPLVATDREKLVVLNLGGGYMGMYHSNLPVFKGESNTMLWTSPMFFFILFLFGAWHFLAKKKDALTSWGTDDPFSSASAATGAPLGNADMDLRGGALRAPPRRYGSPNRYPGGATSSFRPGSADPNPRPVSSVDSNFGAAGTYRPSTADPNPRPVDPSFRAAPELKYRGSALEPTGYPKRRESLFVNSQVLDDGN